MDRLSWLPFPWEITGMGVRTDNARALYLEGIRDGRVREAVTRYTGDRYTQHSTGVADGVEGFVAFFEPFVERNPKRDIRIVRAIEDGRHVFLHVFQSLNEGEAQWVTTDFFDTNEEGKIVEHWDVIAPFVERTASGNTSVDGTVEVTDREKTDENKARVRELFESVLIAGDPESTAAAYLADDLTSHDAEVADGAAAYLTHACSQGRKLAYAELVLLVGEGNFVATLSRAAVESEAQAQVDVFRLADGRIVERWSNREPVPPPEQWGNSGKF